MFKDLAFTNYIWYFLLPIILIILDIITGYIKAWKNNSISSRVMRDGIAKKAGELCYIILGVVIKYAFGIDIVLYFMVTYISGMEIVSIFENCALLGVPIPNKIKERLEGGENNETK